MSGNNSDNMMDHHIQTNAAENNALTVPHYALKIALETMKERCHKLQKRLNSLEDENLQLRIERHSLPGLIKKEPPGDIMSLQREIEELNRQKSLLSHHIYMVATENKELWERLSKVTGEEVLQNVNNINDSFNKSRSLTSKPHKSLQITEVCKNKGGKDVSLEEIPLKLVSNLKKNKFLIEDESEETEQTVALNVRDCKFPLNDIEEQGDETNILDEGVFFEMKSIIEKLKSEKVMLKQQQEGLKAATDILSRYLKEKRNCKKCAILEEELEKERLLKLEMEKSYANNNILERTEEASGSFNRKEPLFSLAKESTQFEDRICPLCTKFYPKSTPFDEFNEHVLSHFVEEPEQDSLMSNYEIAT